MLVMLTGLFAHLRYKKTQVVFPSLSIFAHLASGAIFVMKVFLIIGFASGLAGASYFIYLTKILPDPTAEAMLAAPESTRILDRDGEFLYEVHGEVKRTSIPFSEMPINLRNATVAIEDKDFYHHYGFDFTSILRAVKANFIHGEIRQGASTITQQLARTAFLDNRLTLARKIKELVLAIKIEWLYPKDQILELYLNNIPYGSNAYGIEAASEIYFGKHARDLSLVECAYLAALPKAPTAYSPYGPNIEILHQRAKTVIETMQHLGYLTEIEAETALAQKEIKFKRRLTKINAPHFVFYVIDSLIAEYGKEKVEQGGMIVYTSLDMSLQRRAEKIVREQSIINEKKFQSGNASLIALDPRTGEILTMVGSRDYFKPGDGAFNVSISPRQPGSSFKPYVYATAMMNGLNPATMLLDVATDFANDNHGIKYMPRNYSGRHYGPVSIRKALAGSLNIPAVKTLVMTGIDKSIDTAEKLGLTTLKDRSRFGPALVLGGAEVKLLEHTAGLGALGNNGIKQELRPILKIIDSKNNALIEKKIQPGAEAIDPQAAYLITDILSDTEARKFIFGRNKNLEITGWQVAIKTGTTQDFRDAWTIGYAPGLAVGVWVGNNDNTPMKSGADGSIVAAPIWHQFMTEALAKKTPEKFIRPPGIVELKVDRLTGKLPTKFTPSTKKEIFASYNIPKEKDDAHIHIKTGELDISITHLQSEKPDDPLWESGVRRWSLAAGFLASETVNTYSLGKINDGGIKDAIVFNVPEKITTLPWEVSVETALTQKVKLTEIFLDGMLLVKDSTGAIRYSNNSGLSDGLHSFIARIHTINGDTYSINRNTEVRLSNITDLMVPAFLTINDKTE